MKRNGSKKPLAYFKIVPVLLVVLIMTACSQPPTLTPLPTLTPTPIPSPTPTPTITPTPAPTVTPVVLNIDPITTIKLAYDPKLGPILTDQNGNVLYLFTDDRADQATCTGACANIWPVPVVKVTTISAGTGVDASKIGIMKRSDGRMQPTYSGWPLYYYSKDTDPGQTNGQNIGGKWFVVSSYGSPIQTDAKVELGNNSNNGYGAILNDAGGRTLYMFSKDIPNASACSGACAMLWPPFLTAGNPTADAGVATSLLGTMRRSDGTVQVTYDGWPLYYYSKDAIPGETNGQHYNDVWFVVSPSGSAVQVPPPTPTPSGTSTPLPTGTPIP